MTLQKLANYHPALRGEEKFNRFAAFHRRFRFFSAAGGDDPAGVR
jgi:hypothetical protein